MSWTLNTIIHVCPGGKGMSKCHPDSSYCLRPMNWKEYVTDPCTWVWSLKYPSLSGVVLLEDDFLAAESWFPQPPLFNILSGMFV